MNGNEKKISNVPEVLMSKHFLCANKNSKLFFLGFVYFYTPFKDQACVFCSNFFNKHKFHLKSFHIFFILLSCCCTNELNFKIPVKVLAKQTFKHDGMKRQHVKKCQSWQKACHFITMFLFCYYKQYSRNLINVTKIEVTCRQKNGVNDKGFYF